MLGGFRFFPALPKKEVTPSVGKRKTHQSSSERQPVKRKNRLSAASADQAEHSDPKLVAALCIQGTNSPHHGADSLIATGFPDNLKCLTNRSVLNGAVTANYLNTCANGTVILSAHNGPSLRYSSLAFLGHNPTSRPLLKRSINPEMTSKQRSRSDNAQACRPSERSRRFCSHRPWRNKAPHHGRDEERRPSRRTAASPQDAGP